MSTLSYNLSFSSVNERVNILSEDIANVSDPEITEDLRLPKFFYYNIEGNNGIAQLNDVSQDAPVEELWKGMAFSSEQMKNDASVLAFRLGAENYPHIAFLSDLFTQFKVYAEGDFSRKSPVRKPQNAALDQNFLFEYLRQFYKGVEAIIPRIIGGTVQIYFSEIDLAETVSSYRLSDGTIHYLCLLALLVHPSPPPLICIEEPELGMHPDVIPQIAELLIDASQRTQLIITTHSELLVSAIGAKHPEAIVVCDRTSKGTTLTRLEPDKLQDWLQDYSLGEVWLKGAIGGTRY